MTVVEARIQVACPSQLSEADLRALVASPPVDVVALVAPEPTVVGSCLRYDFDEGALWATVSVDTAKTWGYTPSMLNAIALATRGPSGVTLHGVYLTPLPKEAVGRLVTDVLTRVSLKLN